MKTLIAAATATVISTAVLAESQGLKATANKAFMALFTDNSADGGRQYIAEDIIQHNPHVPTGRDALIDFLPALKAPGITYTNHRMLQDGEFVILHNPFTNAKAFGADKIVTIDIYRMKDGKAAEHRDVIQAVPTEDLANTNGHARWLQQQLRATRPAMKQPRPGLGRVSLLMTRKEEENVDLIADPEDF